MRKKPTKAEVALFAVPGCVLLLILLGSNPRWGRELRPIFAPVLSLENARRASCVSNLSSINLAVIQYSQDYDHYPAASTGPSGWADILQPYIKSRSLFNCPSAAPISTTVPTITIDYWMNARLSNLRLSAVADSSQTLLNGDGIADSSTAYAISSFPKNWPDDPDSPMSRHLNGANYGFLDGHIKWFKPEGILRYGVKRDLFAIR